MPTGTMNAETKLILMVTVVEKIFCSASTIVYLLLCQLLITVLCMPLSLAFVVMPKGHVQKSVNNSKLAKFGIIMT
jgi:hypothetical protein